MREELKHKLWPDETFVDFDHSLNTAVKKLRQALGDNAETPKYIETLPRRGYRFLAPVEKVELAPAPPLWRRRSTWRTAIFGLLALVAGYFAWQHFFTSPRQSPERVMLAVLPFEDLSGDPTQEYLSDGLTEEMITQLGRMRPDVLGVIARTSAMHYKGTKKGTDEIGRELGVDYILEGSVRRADGRVRVSAQLIRVSDQTHLWAESYDRELHDILILQSEVAQEIAREIRITVTPAEATRLASTRPVNPEAHRLYLLGRYHWNKRTPEGFQKAAEHFQQAIDLDPTYALAYAGLADNYVVQPFWGILSPREAHPRAKAAAEQALKIDNSFAEPHATMAFVLTQYEHDWESAERAYLRALELNPNYATARHWYAFNLIFTKREDASIAEIKRAQELDPLSLIISAEVGTIYYFAHQYNEAEEAIHKTLDMDPHFAPAYQYLGWVYLAKGRAQDAVAAFRRSQELSSSEALPMSGLGEAYALTGKREEARRLLERLEKESTKRYVPAADIALIYAHLGEKSRAFQWLEKSFAQRDWLLVTMKVNPRFDILRDDPRFQDLLRRMNFPP